MAGCTAAAQRPAAPGVAADEARFLLSPLSGYEAPLGAGVAQRIDAAHRGLLERGATGPARELAGSLLAADPALPPAGVLAAQVDLVQGRPAEARQRLEPIAAALPGYLAAQLALGRAAEHLDDVPGAFAAYRAIAERSGAAGERAETLRFRALQIVYNRVRDATERGRLEDAMRALQLLGEWAPEETATLQARRRVAVAAGDLEAEREALRQLSDRFPEDTGLLARLAELEVEGGDPGTGLRLLQELAARNPEDPVVAEKLARAKFRWRLVLLPPEVGRLASRPELSRADFAALLYWIFPDVRYGHPTTARIANDVFDHDFRDEIVRSVNLGLLEVDPDLHVFEPERPVRRLEALRSLVMLMARRQPRPACVGELGPVPSPSLSQVCRTAARCRLIAEEADCQGGAPVPGAAAVELARLALDRLGGG